LKGFVRSATGPARLPHISTDAGGLARSATTSSTPRWRDDIQGGDAMIRFAFVFAILLAIASSASAADPATNQAAGLPAPTATFVAMAAAGNLFEIQGSELALRRSHSGAVREFANRMVTDHNAAAAKFKQAMADAKLTPPAEKLDAKHQAILDDLQAKDDASFRSRLHRGAIQRPCRDRGALPSLCQRRRDCADEGIRGRCAADPAGPSRPRYQDA
jgi:predicted outer membrane protein